jgi:hypothetical protein
MPIIPPRGNEVKAGCIMITFTVWGFIAEGGRYLDFTLDIFAESPLDATEKMMKQHTNLVVSNVCRATSGRLVDY